MTAERAAKWSSSPSHRSLDKVEFYYPGNPSSRIPRKESATATTPLLLRTLHNENVAQTGLNSANSFRSSMISPNDCSNSLYVLNGFSNSPFVPKTPNYPSTPAISQPIILPPPPMNFLRTANKDTSDRPRTTVHSTRRSNSIPRQTVALKPITTSSEAPPQLQATSRGSLFGSLANKAKEIFGVSNKDLQQQNMFDLAAAETTASTVDTAASHLKPVPVITRSLSPPVTRYTLCPISGNYKNEAPNERTTSTTVERDQLLHVYQNLPYPRNEDLTHITPMIRQQLQQQQQRQRQSLINEVDSHNNNIISSLQQFTKMPLPSCPNKSTFIPPKKLAFDSNLLTASCPFLKNNKTSSDVLLNSDQLPQDITENNFPLLDSIPESLGLLFNMKTNAITDIMMIPERKNQHEVSCLKKNAVFVKSPPLTPATAIIINDNGSLQNNLAIKTSQIVSTTASSPSLELLSSHNGEVSCDGENDNIIEELRSVVYRLVSITHHGKQLLEDSQSSIEKAIQSLQYAIHKIQKEIQNKSKIACNTNDSHAKTKRELLDSPIILPKPKHMFELKKLNYSISPQNIKNLPINIAEMQNKTRSIISHDPKNLEPYPHEIGHQKKEEEEEEEYFIEPDDTELFALSPDRSSVGTGKFLISRALSSHDCKQNKSLVTLTSSSSISNYSPEKCSAFGETRNQIDSKKNDNADEQKKPLPVAQEEKEQQQQFQIPQNLSPHKQQEQQEQQQFQIKQNKSPHRHNALAKNNLNVLATSPNKQSISTTTTTTTPQNNRKACFDKKLALLTKTQLQFDKLWFYLNDRSTLKPAKDFWDLRDKLEIIQSGGHGTVYGGVYDTIEVAIKIVIPEIRGDHPDTSLQKLIQEWWCLMQCQNHPGVVRLVGALRVEEKEIWVLTERVFGPDLHTLKYVFRCPIEIPEAVKMCAQLARTLQYLHAAEPKDSFNDINELIVKRPLAHYDIKPENILVDHNWSIQLCDFGDAEVISQGCGSRRRGVTWLYAPYELLVAGDNAKNQRITEKADIWAAGCVFHELLGGFNPFRDIVQNDAVEAFRHKLQSAAVEGRLIPKLLNYLPEGFQSLICACLDYNPANRPSAEELAEFWEEAYEKISALSIKQQQV